ncbi:L-aminoadipate-semialdehyde dehydrogenase large subunit [Purpureocillium lilacinum]|uniref:Alpha-aminoadipate reductase n=1 Tax=Purpureocillium lilacinum TaxID=33203 RepID=A0A179GS60_PURLI|nr:L-aminoadipate-semialdehyde dehydrogenase large subunit [Purpureocillium lilacinum]KAK4091716.1 hypothetical protein Purlil1_4146 [Purpureocillium lilacinum]OAQ80765.1 L-aminoadipate-semialdehyde dehydrogenase large subunit [Purpureocillium lilacinum]PWI75546.1 hypothetical protein PCL_06204 [Purpureocillium lilacinum]GJN86343.1 putative NRPS-like protein biosynthetic cluster [Purpureocillium lilacinum]
MAPPSQPDPTIDLDWGAYRGAIHEIFASNAAQFPDRTCVVETRSSRGPERTFTYRQINESSNQLAHHFLANGCQVGDVVAIYAYRGVDLVVAYMGALKAGATVSVLDPQYPPERQKVLLEVANPRFLVCIQRAIDEFGELSALVRDFVADRLQIKSTVPALQLLDDGGLKGGDGQDVLAPHASARAQVPDVVVGPDSIPTLSFTSGSEGRPKGVQGRHFSLTHYFPWMAERFGLSDKDRFTMLSGIAHDPIQRDIFTPLFLGAQIVIPPAELISYELLAEWMRDHRVTVTHLTPAMGQILVGGAVTQFPTLRNAFFVGDLLTKKDCRKLRDLAPNVRIINLYGSTESQRAVSFFEIPSQNEDEAFFEGLPDIMPVGQGMRNVQLLVVDRDDRSKLCGIGEQGELFIRAAGLAEGYLGDDEKTTQLNRDKFLTNWFVDPAQWTSEYERQRAAGAYDAPWTRFYKGPRDRLYRTGDLGRRREDGSVECTGRIDSQVKIRGFRIELGEIDASLSQHPYVRENITVVRRDKNEEQTLVTYFVPEIKRWLQHLEQDSAQEVDESMGAMLRRFKSLTDDCKSFLAAKVPKYAVPSIFIPLVRMPLNPNGKVDRPALPFPDAADLALLGRRRASSTTTANMTDTQRRLAAIWAGILPNRTARMFVPASNFFEEGGHSILAQQMFFKLKQEWKGIDLPVRVIFQSQTLEALAAEIDRAQDPIGLRLDAMPLPADSDAGDEAYAADARELVRQLPASIQSAPAEGLSSPVMLLTGATGFLGSYILHELLEGPAKAARVVAHVRAKDAASGLARLETTSKAYGLWKPSWVADSRIEAVVGDISKQDLGLSSEAWERLTREVDVIIHNGAQVNWMLPYSSLRAANVLSTLACVGLCATGKPKRLAFVSSTSTLDSAHYVDLSRQSPILEADDLEGSRKGLGTGYGQSKWASEYMVREAGKRGLVGAVVRPGYVTGDPDTGMSVTDDFLVRLWKGCLQVGARPDIANTVNTVPVKQVARITVAAALQLPAVLAGQPLGVAQLTSHPRVTLNDWIGALEVYGHSVPRVPYREWCDRVVDYIGDTSKEEHALLPLFHFVVGDLPADTVAPELDDRNAAAALQRYTGESDALAKSAVDVDILGRYLAYLIAAGFLPAPTRAGERPLPQLDDDTLQSLAAGARSVVGSRARA